jgi:hypothetical protein
MHTSVTDSESSRHNLQKVQWVFFKFKFRMETLGAAETRRAEPRLSE